MAWTETALPLIMLAVLLLAWWSSRLATQASLKEQRDLYREALLKAQSDLDRTTEDLKRVNESFRHHVLTMRQQGFTAQPMDEEWEAHTISDELAAEIELDRSRGLGNS
jgi:hypothetical protein